MAELLGQRSGGARRLRELLARPAPVLAPGAYDALSARLVEEAGFPAVYMTGFGTSAAYLGRPDVGPVSYTHLESFHERPNGLRSCGPPVDCFCGSRPD